MDMSQLRIKSFRSALVLAVGVTLYFAFTPVDDSIGDQLDDKLNHFLAFAVLAFLADFSFPQQRFAISKVLPLLAFGVVIEGVQYFLPSREASLYDVLADGVGIAAYAFVRPWLQRIPWLRFQWQT